MEPLFSLRKQGVVLSVVIGDITTLKVDAIVNAANSALSGGGGVDGAIHRVAGPNLLKECRTLGRCAAGDAKITRGYLLPAKFVIHAVGPVWDGGERGEPQALASCYATSLALGKAHDVASIAFPCISTGVYRFPAKRAAAIAFQTTLDLLPQLAPPLREIVFCCFSETAARDYKELMEGADCRSNRTESPNS